MTSIFSSIDDVIRDVKDGMPVIIVDDPDRENEGDVFVAASLITEEHIAFMRDYAKGKICVPMEPDRLDYLELPLMVPESYPKERLCRFTITVDARNGRRDSGMTDRDRTITIGKLADPQLGPNYFIRPGHVEPLRAERNGLLIREGHTEAAVDLARAVNLKNSCPAGVICEVMPDGTMFQGERLYGFAREHNLRLISINQIKKHIYLC